MKSALETAISYANRGWYVFPIMSGSKKPYPGRSWKVDSTNDVDKIKKAGTYGLYKNCNWALDCEKSGIFVVDIDTKKVSLDEALSQLQKKPTSEYIVETPSGGLHYYYKGKAPSSIKKIGPDIDTKSVGGYVIIPGSVVSEYGNIKYKYTGTDVPDIPEIPQWLHDELGKASERKDDWDIPVTELDQEPHVKTAIEFLKNDAPEAIEGEGGDQTTYEIACRVRDQGISKEKTIELMGEYWNETKAKPPWTPNELSKKVSNAFNYAKDRPGNASPEAMFADIPENTDNIRTAGKISLMDIPPRRWVLEHRFAPGYTTVTVAPGGTGKSLLSILEGMAVVTNKKMTYNNVVGNSAVWLYNMEDPFDELERRIMAVAKHFKLSQTQIEKFFYSSGYENPLKLAARDDRGRPVKNTKAVNQLIKDIKEREIKLFIVDPLVRCHSLTENDNDHMDFLMSIFANIADQTDCAIHIIHHTNKSKAEHGNADASRGASAVINAARIAHTFYNMGKKEAKIFGISMSDVPFYVRLTNAKANLTPPSKAFSWYKKVSVKLKFDDDDTTGTLEMNELNQVEEVDERDVLINMVFDRVKPGGDKTTFSLAKDIKISGLIQGDERTIQRKIVKTFERPVKMTGLVFKLRERNKGSKKVTTIECIDEILE